MSEKNYLKRIETLLVKLTTKMVTLEKRFQEHCRGSIKEKTKNQDIAKQIHAFRNRFDLVVEQWNEMFEKFITLENRLVLQEEYTVNHIKKTKEKKDNDTN